ncbi:MAG TPA: hypothetical protein EYQ44_06410 [Porticoccaceae bacterium]|nr:hypothetical protein [Porticoccaceae bacterium]HIK79597.1 hypothetical protein [Porticoccaceae bacterium]
MSLAVLELNDQALLVHTEQGQCISEPGFAQLTSKGIQTGEVARSIAWRSPQSSFNQYWRQLNQLPLPSNQTWARHNADIAFAQIQQLLNATGAPGKLILSVPGSFSDEQMSLLTGLVDASSCQLHAVIDSALAAGLDCQNQTWIVELQLHQTVVSLIQPQNKGNQGSIDIVQQELIPDLGIMTIYNSVARHISNSLVTDYRYDPLHNSEGEQTIYDQIPTWLSTLAVKPEITIIIGSPKGELPLVLRKNEIEELVEGRLAKLTEILESAEKTDVVFTHSGTIIGRLASRFATARLLSADRGCQNCFSAQQEIALESEQLHRIRSLKTGLLLDEITINQTHQSSCATHLLHDNQAWSLSTAISIYLKNDQLSFKYGADKDATLALMISDSELGVLYQQSGNEVLLPKSSQPGGSIVIAGHKVKLIEVNNG